MCHYGGDNFSIISTDLTDSLARFHVLNGDGWWCPNAIFFSLNSVTWFVVPMENGSITVCNIHCLAHVDISTAVFMYI